MSTLLLDSDLVAFRCAASAEDAPQDIAIARADNLMRELLHSTGASQYCAFLTGSNNFRKKINLDYKANRKDKPLPKHLQSIREFLVIEWKAQVSDGCEADDLLGINQTEDTIIASLDKDLLMIPGYHFNWVKDTTTYVDSLTGLRHFYKQMLIGDRSDNIFGMDGIGPVKASRLIDNLDTEEDMIDIVFKLYDNPERFVMNAQCLWIMQKEGETWANRNLILPDQLKLVVETMLGSMNFSMNATSTVPITTEMMMSGILCNGIIPESIPVEEVPLI